LTLFFDIVEPLDYWHSKRTGDPFEEEKYRLIEKSTRYGKRYGEWHREKENPKANAQYPRESSGD